MIICSRSPVLQPPRLTRREPHFNRERPIRNAHVEFDQRNVLHWHTLYGKRHLRLYRRRAPNNSVGRAASPVPAGTGRSLTLLV
jgi:hypothetical protein